MDWESERVIIMDQIKSNDFNFEEIALKLYSLQYSFNPVFRRYSDLIKKSPGSVKSILDIPFLPIRFFKEFEIRTGTFKEEAIFISSGTSQMVRSRHIIRDLDWYHWNSGTCFNVAFSPETYLQFNHIGYLPSYASNPQSSLLKMIDQFIKESGGGFFHEQPQDLIELVETKSKKTNLIWGVSYALYSWPEHRLWPDSCRVIETGGMKGRGREITREELHEKIKSNFEITNVISEYGMTELLSQCYALSEGVFVPTAGIKIFPRRMNDPLCAESCDQAAALNIIDLANLDSCAFIATDDLGKVSMDGRFTVTGRMDNSDIRGCNLLL